MSGSSNQSSCTSPGSYNTAQRTASVSSGSSPPHHQPLPAAQFPPRSAQNDMSADVYSPGSSHISASLGSASTLSYPFSPITLDMRLGDSDRSLDGFGRAAPGGAILMRKLPRNTSREALRSMLLFAKDFVDADFIATDLPEDNGFLCAIARFNTLAAAEEARALLDGKPNSKNDATMIVELWNSPVGGRRNTIDHTANATATTTTSSSNPASVTAAATRGLFASVSSANGPLSRQSSRFNGTFQTLERLTAGAAPSHPDALSGPGPEAGARLHSLFSPQSPIGNGVGVGVGVGVGIGVSDRPRVTGKSMIDQDPDEDTGELLKDPVGYAESGHGAVSSVTIPRRSTNPQIPTSRFANLSLTTSNALSSPPLPNYAPGGPGGGAGPSARMGVGPGPSSAFSPAMNGAGPGGAGGPGGSAAGNQINGAHGYHYGSQHTPRHSLPAANPNDLNPPCNTLYVGNLPPDTSEEELKALFSKQRGYKRLCFRNKQNGPMCFVEFDEVAMASKALNELYGYKLSNSVKTGIRLSFSKNPLGVRSGQPGSLSASNALAPQGAIPGGGTTMGGTLPSHMFSSVSGPPPGLAAPPGLSMPLPIRNGALHPATGNPHAPPPPMASPGAPFNPNSGLGIRTNGVNLNAMMMPSPPLAGGVASNGAGPNMNGFNSFYPDYMMGR
ncbi:hypothetical protein ASPZODRAFT_14453 [Penicilliopsis zonata CBS 506.65]|uniref:RRM domain-containing protein n=1 Tax=Penicilliopsis zonata CBS 506.65 TaxID=1073090 RepID=A0A1L9SMG9_9EURO|nr:hypothetical protein ASPZODRAFT_14453 [Penicilliopsis zonata CBS 506.65]OJJ48306.1 hypothetical protein ASPZODRAFT_14453 [Penicilliopsis zonata CBS 506.65]